MGKIEKSVVSKFTIETASEDLESKIDEFLSSLSDEELLEIHIVKESTFIFKTGHRKNARKELLKG